MSSIMGLYPSCFIKDKGEMVMQCLHNNLRYRIEYVYLSIKDAHDRQYNYMKITIFTLIGMIRLIGFNIQDIQIPFCCTCK